MAGKHFNFKLQIDSTQTITPKISAVSFGDGYEQVVSHGINNLVTTWSCHVQGKKTVIDTALAFLLDTKGVTPFVITPIAGEPSVTVRLDGAVNRSNVGGDIWQIAFAVKQVF
ncbi:MAG: phage tail protein [Moraxella sp.]|nr:phage tail protein [Moraxella sp.]